VAVDRPAPAAAWEPGLPPSAWAAARLRFARPERLGPGGGGAGWTGQAPEGWVVSFPVSGVEITLRLKAGAGGQVGAFPEQWPVAARLALALARAPGPAAVSGRERSFLSVFAHTGAATLAALAVPGVRATHVDAAPSAVARAKANAEASGLAGRPVRWAVDDARAFLAREARRGARHDAILLDPPAFGRAPRGRAFRGGQDWKLTRDFPDLLAAAKRLLSPEGVFFGVCWHAPDWESSAVAGQIEAAAAGWPAPGGAWRHERLGLASIAGGRTLPAGRAAIWAAF
jgi:23S rRNA (cytosine1962-C5)-methyltransferase